MTPLHYLDHLPKVLPHQCRRSISNMRPPRIPPGRQSRSGNRDKHVKSPKTAAEYHRCCTDCAPLRQLHRRKGCRRCAVHESMAAGEAEGSRLRQVEKRVGARAMERNSEQLQNYLRAQGGSDEPAGVRNASGSGQTPHRRRLRGKGISAGLPINDTAIGIS